MEERSYRSFQYDTLGQSHEHWHDPRDIPGWAEVLPEDYLHEDVPAHVANYSQREWFRFWLLLVLTCCSTFFVGMELDRVPSTFSDPEVLRQFLSENWLQGLTYMLAVMGILMAHEMGHFLQALRYHVRASLPFFIPLPIPPIGTMGAVIAMRGSQANRKELFDIGLTGPLAGLVIAIPVFIVGLLTAQAKPPDGGYHLGAPLLARILISWLGPDIPAGQFLHVNSLMMAGWVGMFITGLNMIPVSQLDGGHVSYALFGRWSWTFARLILIGVMAFIVVFQAYQWLVMLLLVMMIGPEHPPTRNDHVPIGRWRYALGMVSLALPILCMTPVPIS